MTVLAGTDMVVYGSPLLPLPRELQYMVEYGITPVQAIQTATSNPAKVLGFENERGLVKEGLDADLLVVGGDLSKDITLLNDVKWCPVIFLIMLCCPKYIFRSHINNRYIKEHNQNISKIRERPQVSKFQTCYVTHDTKCCHKKCNSSDYINESLVLSNPVRSNL